MNDNEERSVELSERESQVLRLVVRGLSNKEIARELFLSVETVKTHMKSIFVKLAVSHRTAAAVKAIKCELISLER